MSALFKEYDSSSSESGDENQRPQDEQLITSNNVISLSKYHYIPTPPNEWLHKDGEARSLRYFRYINTIRYRASVGCAAWGGDQEYERVRGEGGKVREDLLLKQHILLRLYSELY